MFVRETVMVGGRPLTFETGRLAKQAHGSIFITFGGSQVLVTAVSGEPRAGLDFFPLTCEYFEKTYAAGKIPGGFFKREARQRDYEILASRVIDRPMRPLFPKGFKNDTQIIATVVSADKINPTDVLALTAASAAVHISDIPWDGPIAGVRVSRVDGKLIVLPTFEESAKADIDLVVACSADAIMMVEGGAAEASEAEIIDALMFAHDECKKIIAVIEKLRAGVGKPKRAFSIPKLEETLARRVSQLADDGLREACVVKAKHARYDAYAKVKKATLETIKSEIGEERYLGEEKLLKDELEHRKAEVVRTMVLDTGKRIDGRTGKDIRAISCEVGLLARTHGSSLFQRGETQALVTATLGTNADEQKIDALTGESWKQFMLHYNFPPFSTGETKPMRGPGRREVGHGALAERALARMVPEHGKFPYTIRVVSETLESNGSSSMASVCGGTLALMDAGVPIKKPVAGIAMGLISEGNHRFAILSDILGDEDHLGDMDFKVCGTDKGITAIQMDIKIAGLARNVMEQALEQAREGRLHILGKMLATLDTPRAEINQYAPRITTIKVKPDQIRVIIGPGGKTIKGITEQTGCAVNVEDDGTVNVAGTDPDAVKRALEIIEGLVAEPEVGKVYKGTVKRIVDFGAFVEILPGNEALLHVSEMAWERVEHPSDLFKEGDVVEVKCISIERDGKTRLSRRALLPEPEGGAPRREGGDRGGDRGPRGDRGDRGPRRDGDRGPRRDGDRGPRGDRGDRGPRRDGDRGPRPDRGPRGDDLPRVTMSDAPAGDAPSAAPSAPQGATGGDESARRTEAERAEARERRRRERAEAREKSED